VLRGRTVTTVAKCQFDAEGGGATYVDQAVVVSGNLVTARTWHDNAPFMREFMKLLNKVAPPSATPATQPVAARTTRPAQAPA